MNRQGPSHQPLRMGGFQPVGASAQARGTIANGKITGGWSGVPPPPGVPTPGSRPTMTFSQSVGGLTQPSAPLDLNEFPALGGQPSANPSAAWNRVGTASPQNRGAVGGGAPPPSQQPSQHPQLQQQQQHQLQQQEQSHGAGSFAAAQGTKDVFGSAALDDYRIGGGIGVGGGGGTTQQQQQNMPPSSMEEFPPLAARATPGAMGGLEGLGGQRGGSMGSRILPQMDGMMPQQQGVMHMSEAEKKNLLKGSSPPLLNGAPGLSNMNPSNIMSSIPPQGQQPPSQSSPVPPGLPRPGQQQHPQTDGSPKAPESLNGDAQGPSGPPGFLQENLPNGSQGLGEQQYGLSHLVHNLRPNNPVDGGELAGGRDLTNLGLDISTGDDVLMWQSFSTPFPEFESKMIEPDFYLPQCYSVRNTQPLDSKLQNFSDETLFYIFYTMPRDLMQEIVANELSQRNWRFHMLHRLWMTKDHTGEVQQLSETAEKGVYIFFDPTSWEKVRKEIILEYSHLDPRTTGSHYGGSASHGLMANSGVVMAPGLQ